MRPCLRTRMSRRRTLGKNAPEKVVAKKSGSTGLPRGRILFVAFFGKYAMGARSFKLMQFVLQAERSRCIILLKNETGAGGVL